MKRVYRRLLFFIATVVFLALAPMVILYAMGYRTLATQVDPIPVGVVLLETYPRRAVVWVNELEAGRTPRAVPKVPAGNVRVRLALEGYANWEKSIPVKPGLITELRTVRLFAASPVAREIAPQGSLISLSPNRQLLAVYAADGLLRFFDQEGELVAPPVPLTRAPERLTWAPNNAAVLITSTATTHYLVPVTAGVRATPTLLTAIRGATNVVWDTRLPGRLLVQTAAGTLRAYNTTNQTSTAIAATVERFGVSSRQIFVATASQLQIYSLQGVLQRSLPLPENEQAEEILVTSAGAVALQTESQALYVLTDTQWEQLAPAVQTAAWSPDGNMLFMQTEPTALYVYNVRDERSSVPLKQVHLVTRLSRPISHPQWFAGGNHLIYQVDDELRITEIDTRDHAIEHRVDTTNNGNAQVMVGENGDVLFYLKREDDIDRVVVLPLVVTTP